jgi:hypothetical protein
MVIKKIMCSIMLCSVFLTLISACVSPKAAEKFAEKITVEYDVVSVDSYIKTETNIFGAILQQYRVYSFTYLDGQDCLQHEEICHYDYGITKVNIGDSNKYVIVEQGFDRYETLYLTEDTLSTCGVNSQ